MIQVLHSFVALQAAIKTPSFWCGLNPACSNARGWEWWRTGWNGDTSGADRYLSQHPETRGVYEWDNNDPISTELQGKFSSYTFTPDNDGNAHTYLEHQAPDAHVLCAIMGTAPAGVPC